MAHKLRLRPLREQVILITGASSGIGLATAEMASAEGAALVLVARDREALRDIAGEITASGGRAIPVAADVSNEEDVQRAAEIAERGFGRIDTWVNNAGVGIYGRATEVSVDDAKRLMEINYFGPVNGSLAAIRHFERRRSSGDRNGMAIVNVGSTESDRALPLHSHYAASKHALRGFTDALRMELEEAELPISVTLVKPGSIDTPFIRHARNYLENEPSYPSPVYAAEVAARTILYAATHPVRDLYAGGGGWMTSALGRFVPRLTDRLMERSMFDQQQQRGTPNVDGEGALRHQGALGAQKSGGYPGRVRTTSLYTAAELHPLAIKVALGAVALAGAGLAWQKRSGSRNDRADSFEATGAGEAYRNPNDEAMVPPT